MKIGLRIGSDTFSSRTRVVGLTVIAVGLLLIAKLYFVSVVHGDEYRDRANRQYSRPNQSLFNRGTVYFENKDGTTVGAATLKSGFVVAMNPKQLTDAEVAYQKITALIPLDRNDFLAKSARTNEVYEEIAKRVSEEVAPKIDAEKIAGISIYKDRWRFYPSGRLAAQVLGFVGYKGDVVAGRYGLESYYDDVLSRSGNGLYTNFFADIFSNVKKAATHDVALQGDIVATLEPSVEGHLERALLGVQEEWKSKSTGGIVMNPKTGEIYALSVIPSFDPNSFQTEKNPALFSNPIVEHVFEMGSILKPLTVAAGIDSKTITAASTYDDKGFLLVNNAKISNYDGKGRGVVSMQEVLNQSLNTGAAYVALKMGNEKFSQYFYNFKLGEETGIDLPNETAGLVDNLKSPRDVEHATASFGQGIAMSPIAITRALATLANGGVLVTPHIVKRIEYKIGLSKKITADEGTRVISKDTADEVTRMLVKVVDTALLGGTVKVPHYSIAAKTGTAQIAKENGRGYYDDRYLHSFFGYFPAYNAKFLVFLYTVEPQASGQNFASHTLTRPFMDMAKFLINYYEIPPDR